MKWRFLSVMIVTIFTFLSLGTLTSYATEMQSEHFKTNKQCLNCHGKPTLSVTTNGKQISLYMDVYQYEASVHGEYSCLVCHQFSEHHVYGKELRNRVSQKCANCHTGAAFDYNRSVHKYPSSKEQPNCVDCHGGHYMGQAENQKSQVAGANQAKTCAEKCHQTEYIQFTESFHGKASALGSKNAPNCNTCHGYHKILAKKNKAALINKENKSHLCLKCHAGDVLGVNSIEHYEIKSEGYGKPMYYVKTKMPWLIIVVLGVFLIHIILDLLQRIRKT